MIESRNAQQTNANKSEITALMGALRAITLIFLIVVTTVPAVARAEWGNLKGQFIFDGDAPEPVKIVANAAVAGCGGGNRLFDESLVIGEGGGIRYVVIYLNTKSPKVHPDYAADAKKVVKFDNKACRFEPHILPIVVGQTLEILNSDPISHNTNLAPIGDKHINPNIPPGQKETYEFRRSQGVPVQVACNSHTWMKAYIIPRGNPYVVVTDAEGKFEMTNLPAGELEFRVWHELPGYLEAKPEWKLGLFKFTIKEGANDLGEIKVVAASLESKKKKK